MGIQAWLSARGAKTTDSVEWLLTCPMCGKLKLAVNTDKRVWHCWVCQTYTTGDDGLRRPLRGAGGLVSLVMLVDRCSAAEAREVIGSDFCGHVSLDRYPQLEAERFSSLTRPIQPPVEWLPITSEPMAYLASRGITWKDVVDYGLGWCKTGWLANRVIFPVFEQGLLVYWQARSMVPTQKKTLNPSRQEGFAGAGDVLFGLDLARRSRRVVITEGPIDAIHVGRHAVATFGKAITSTQIAKLKYFGVRAVDLMWDGPSSTEPSGAWVEMEVAAKKLSGLFDVRLIRLPWGDPGNYTQSELESLAQDGVCVPGLGLEELCLG